MTGRKFFYALGQSNAALGIKTPPSRFKAWPTWAQRAYVAGSIDQNRSVHGSEHD